MPLRYVRRLVVLGALAVTTTLSACGDSPASTSVVTDTPASTVAETSTAATLTTTTTLPTATSPHTTTPARSTPPTSEPASAIVGADISVDTDTVWKEVFEAFTVSERACITNAVGEELLELVLDRPVLVSSVVPEQWESSIFSCLANARQTGRALYLSFIIAGLESDEVWDMELTDEEMTCLREWVAGVDVDYLLAGDPDASTDFGVDLVGCIGDLLDVPAPHPMVTTFAFENATAVAVDQETQDELDKPYKPDFFAFDAVEGKLYQIDVTLGTLDNSVVTLYDADKTELAFNPVYKLTGSTTSRISWMAPSSGRYHVEIASWSGDTGSYTLTLGTSDLVDDHADTVAQATSVMVDKAIPGVVHHSNDRDLFVFDAVEGSLYQIDVTLGTLDNYAVTLYDADKTELAFHADYNYTGPTTYRIPWVAPSSGRYHVEVASSSGDSGSYTLTIHRSIESADDSQSQSSSTPPTSEPADPAVEADIGVNADTVTDVPAPRPMVTTFAFENATAIAVDQETQDELDRPYRPDFFAFDAVEGRLYQIDMTLGTLGDSQVTLYDAEAALVEYVNIDDYGDSSASIVWAAPSRIVWVAPSSGRYYVEVATLVHPGTGSYTLTVGTSDFVDDHADTAAQATSVVTGEPVPGVVHHSNDHDLFIFDAAEGTLYQIDMTLGTLKDTQVTLYDAEATPLVEYIIAYGDSSASIVWLAPKPGRYYVEVAAWSGNTGTYTLTIILR